MRNYDTLPTGLVYERVWYWLSLADIGVPAQQRRACRKVRRSSSRWVCHPSRIPAWSPSQQKVFSESPVLIFPSRTTFGFAALEGLSRGVIQMAMGNEFSFATMINDDPSLRLIASVALVNTNEVVARRDRKIHEPADLKGKRIGFCPNTSSEYYLLAFLLIDKIAPIRGDVVNIPASGLAEAIGNGDVDAVSGWDTNSLRCEKTAAGERHIVAGTEQPGVAMDFGSQGQHDSNPQAVKAVSQGPPQG